MPTPERVKALELGFAAVFSAVILCGFYTVMSMNGLVLGNDPAFHLGRAEMLLTTGRIPMGDFLWYPPLYHVLLATLISFTGATNIEQMLFLMKALTALTDWLLIFSVYLMGAKFLGKKYGVFASLLMLLSFPFYEINLWGGYTSILSLAFMCLLFLNLPLMRKGVGPVLVTFVMAFSLVLSHQLTTFLTAVILPPFILVMLAASKGNYPKAWIAALLGGAIAFFIYYFQPITARLDILISHVFFDVKTMPYQVPFVDAYSFLVNFGFILFFALFGIFLTFLRLRKERKLSCFLLLSLSLFIPFLFSQSYLFGLYMEYGRFIYYLLPSLAIFAAVTLSFMFDLFSAFYFKIRKGQKGLVKIVAFSFVLMMFLLFAFRFQIVYAKVGEGAYFYSTCSVNGYDAAVWLRENFPNATTVVVNKKPGSWFGVYSGKLTIAETDPLVERNVLAGSVLDLSYEVEHSLTLVKTYVAKGYISDEYYVSINSVWKRVSYLSEQGVFLSFRENDVAHNFDISGLNREIALEQQSNSKNLVIRYFNDEIVLTESMLVQNDSYPIDIVWTVSPLKYEIDDVALYVSYFLDLGFSFEKAYVSGLLDWANPWSNPSYVHGNNEWAVVNFSRENLAENYIGAYDDKNEVAFGLKFVNLPDWGNVGALSSEQIDAFRFQYQFGEVKVNQTASSSYQILTLSKSSFSEMEQPSELKNLFTFKPESAFEITSRTYADYVKEFKIEFLVYDKNGFDINLLRSNVLQLVYSNNGYVICRIKNNT